MKKTFMLLVLSAFLTSCVSATESQSSTPPPTDNEKESGHAKTNPRQKRNRHIHYTHLNHQDR